MLAASAKPRSTASQRSQDASTAPTPTGLPAATAQRKRKGVRTIVATGDASIAALVQSKKRKLDEHRQRRETLLARLSRVETQLRTLRRTRRNIRTYNALIEQRDTLSRNLALHDAAEPDSNDLYADLRSFFDQSESANELLRKDEKSGAQSAEEACAEPSDAAAQTSAASKETHIACAESSNNVPQHCAVTVTSGSPIFDAQQFTLLQLARADIQQRMRRRIEGDVERGHTARASERMSALMAQRMRAEIDIEQACLPIAYVLSPLGTGSLPACSRERMETTQTALETFLQSGGVTTADASGRQVAGDSSKALTVTIGKTGGDRATSARLDVKMKDIRNMQNLSIRNFVSVTEREKTHEEVQHENFRQFLAERAKAAEAAARPQYADGTCETCGEELDIDLHGGMVSCMACGATYADGIDSHQWHAVPHVPHSKFQYLKSGHLLSLLKRFQGKEQTTVPRDVINRVVLRLHEYKYDLSKIGYKEMKFVLRRLVLARYYEHVWQLLYIVTGRKPWQFTAQEEIEFQVVFDVLEQVYPLFKPPESENFIFYWYFIKKTAQLLGQPEQVVDMFPLLKDPRKHQQKERIWKNMVEHVGWPYYVTYHDSESRKAMNL